MDVGRTVVQEREDGLDPASSCGCGEKWVDPREIVEYQQDQDWMGKQEEVSLMTFGSPSMHFQQRGWGTSPVGT